ncbi:amidase [Herbiconiux liukaitaii]|uniref:amidase n=1 Tax=Herbiconiux liukaitaii TaxID=3342799 RepID=UPI0035B76E1F
MSHEPSTVLATIASQLDDALVASRARPLPAAPSALQAEPLHSAHLFARMLAETVAAEASAARLGAEPLPSTRPVASGSATASHSATAVRMLGVDELLGAYGARDLTPTAVIAELEPLWSAPRHSDAVLRVIDGIATAAAESTARWAAGTARPLEGIPFAVKDIIDVEGTMVTSGSLQTGDRIAPTDATVVARLRAAGAIPVFMAATTEFACGGPVNARYGFVRNPWDPERWTGGSSTGSGSALAGRIVPLALGTDTGGSIRVPAALCGTTGIKPTYGLVPRTGVASLSWTMDHVGPMARSARDLVGALAVMAGADGVDPATHEVVPSLEADPRRVRGMRIGVPRAWFTERSDTAVLAAFEEALSTFRALGAEIVELDFDALGHAGSIAEIDSECWTVFYGELASNQEANAATAELFDAGMRARVEVSAIPSAADYLRALRRRPLAQAAVVERMDEHGVELLITPGVGATAPRWDDLTMQVDGTPFNLHEVIPRNTRIFDYLGFPALMMPAGFAPDGLPVGVQLIARPWQDASCLSAAVAFQDATTFHTRAPAVSSREIAQEGSSHH